MKEIMVKVLEYQPGLIVTLLERGDPNQGHHPEPTTSQPGWCKCGNCREMPTDAERKCCGLTAINCLSKHPVRSQVVVCGYNQH